MEITGTKCYINIKHNGKTARFGGELGIDGFYAIRDSMHWLPPHDSARVTNEEKDNLVADVLEEVEGYKDKVFFE
ncbi:MAG: Imm74 family immunity protein [Oscillospiraceae bacterium]|nr:Imm74 family immunity protein [Oscillospiraceae bacterium]